MVWKECRGWKIYTLRPYGINKNEQILFVEDYDKDALTEILKRDPKAVLMRFDLGSPDDLDVMTQKTLANMLRWIYEEGHDQLENWRIVSVAETESPEGKPVRRETLLCRVGSF